MPRIDDLHDDIKEILQKVTRIETAIWPDEGQPSKLTDHEERIAGLEKYKSYLTGAVAIIGSVLGIHMGRGK